MTDHLPRLHRLHSTSQLLKETTTSFSSNFFTFLLLAFLLLSFRTVVQNGAVIVTSLVDHNPSLNALLSRLDHNSSSTSAVSRRRHRHRQLLHLTRVGTLGDDLFSGDGDDHHRVNRNFSPNGSFVIFTDFDSMLGFSEAIRPGVTFKTEIADLEVVDDVVMKDQGGEEESRVRERENGIQFLVNVSKVDQRDAAAMFYLVCFLAVAYGWVVLSFTVTYSWVLGMVFTSVVSDLTGKFSSLIRIFWDGSRLGLKRISRFIILRWAVRDVLTQFLGLWYFGEIESQFSCFKLLLRLKLMPFPIIVPWIRGFEKEVSGFLLTWFFMDTTLALVFAVDAWVVVADSRRQGREIVKEGWRLLSIMLNQAVQLKCLEAIVCGSIVRGYLAWGLGDNAAVVIQSILEVYFMVAWLLFYFSVRCRDAGLQGKTFGRRELEDMNDRLR